MRLGSYDKETYLPYIELYLKQKVDEDEIIGLKKLQDMAAMICPDVSVASTRRVISAFIYVIWYLVSKKHRSITIPTFMYVRCNKRKGMKGYDLDIRASTKLKSNEPYTTVEKMYWEEPMSEKMADKYKEFRKVHGDLPDTKPVFYYWWYSEQEEKE